MSVAGSIDFSSYLRSLLEDKHYREWQDLYTHTDVEDRRKLPQSKFSPRLKLKVEMVQTTQNKKNDQTSVEEQREKIEQLDVLDGLRKYAADHVLLLGKPGSGKSTSLERLLWEEAEKALANPQKQIPVLVRLRRCTSTLEALIRNFLSSYDLLLNEPEIERLLHLTLN